MKTNDDYIKLLLGKRIRRLRKAKKWTQEKLGERAELNYKFLGEIERGKQNPSIVTLIKLADALEISIAEFFNFENSKNFSKSNIDNFNRADIEKEIFKIIKNISDKDISQVLFFLQVFYLEEV
jgi:transcriptional regulator with XRE-family HTH domain